MSPIKLLAISASPRKHGNSMYFIEQALEGLSRLSCQVQVERYSFAGKKIGPCTGCSACYKNGGVCLFQDDFAALRQLWLEADCVIYCTPVYVAGLPGQLKCFIDRLSNSEYGCPYDGKTLSVRHMKPMGAISQGGDFFGGQELCAIDIMRHAAMANCLYVAPDGSYFGSCAWAEYGPTGHELQEKTEQGTKDMAFALETAQSVVYRTAELAWILREGTSALRDILAQDPRHCLTMQKLEVQQEKQTITN